jgi:hypothetical protein
MKGVRWRLRRHEVIVLVALVLLGGAIALLAGPRQRAFRLGGPGGTPADPGGVAATSPLAAVTPGRRVPLPNAQGRIVVPVADRIPPQLPVEGTPAGWALKEFTGRASVELVRAEPGLALRLRSSRTSFALYRDVIVDLKEFPMLSWSWKVVRLPTAADVRRTSTDDEAAQVYVVFPRWPSPLTTSDVIGYVWDSRAPVGTRLESPKAANVRIIVVESGRQHLGSWRRQERNVAADYVALFGRQPLRVGQVAVMIDSNDTWSDAEALFGDLVFSRGTTGRVGIPTSMLR